ncbi:MAG: DNA/RNA non-specific endonuclease [Candidatus Rhabdochlamydia sp.]
MKIKRVICYLSLIVLSFMGGVAITFHPSFQEALLPPFFPKVSQVIYRKAYALAYDGKIKGASFVYEELKPSSGDTAGASFRFKEDPLIPKSLRSTLLDFKGSRFDRGHLCSAASALTLEAKKETFYLSNISPQVPDLNRKLWLKLERYARSLIPLWDKIYVITGPLFMPQTDEKGARYIRYEVIGPQDVAVPSHYFKVLYKVKDQEVFTEAFMMPNHALSQSQEALDLKLYHTSLETIEKMAGITLKKNF